MIFIRKNAERVAYVLMLVSVKLGFLLVNILSFLSFLIPKNQRKDIIFFPYAETDSIGYILRFKVYINLLEKDNYRFDIMRHYHENEVNNILLSNNRIKRYFLYQAILWKRIFQILKARNYKTAFVQRSLYPWYPYYEIPYLEMLLKKICNDVIIDIWDANHVSHPTHTFSVVSVANKITVVNQHLLQAYAKYNQNVQVWPIAVDIKRYCLKQDYSLKSPIKFLYTGSPDNVSSNLTPILGLLKEIGKIYPLELIVIGKYAPIYRGLKIEHRLWEEETYYDLLAKADIGLFPVFDSQDEINKGKVAAKTLDYLAAGLPFIGSRDGVPEGVGDGDCYLAADDLSEWKSKLIKLINDQSLREKMAERGRKFVEENLSIETSYAQLKKICFMRQKGLEEEIHNSIECLE